MRERDSERRLNPRNVTRGLLRAGVVLLCTALLTAGVFVSSRYLSNRRLMALQKLTNRINVDVAFGWKGPKTDWLERWVGADAAMAALCRPVSLIVSGDPSKVDDATVLTLLRSSSELEEIFIHNRNLTDGCLEAIATRHRPETFHFQLPTIRHSDSQLLSQMTRLKHVNISQFVREPRNNDWSWLKDLPVLESLAVTLWGATNADAAAFAECSATTSLSLSGESLSDDTIIRFCDLPALQFLDLEGPRVRLHFPAGRKLPATLESLDLRSTSIDDVSLATIDGLPRINRISITGGKITDTSLAMLARLPALNQLWLSDLRLTDNGLKSLIASQSLTEFLIERCGTTSLGMISMNDIPNWRELRYERVQFRREPGSVRPILTPEFVDHYISAQRDAQSQMNRQMSHGPSLPGPWESAVNR